MLSPESGSHLEGGEDPWESTPMGWPLGAVTLASLVSPDGRFCKEGRLPARLLNPSYLNRPWPVEPLDERVIDLDYADWVPPLPPDQSQDINIVDDRRLRLGDKEYPIRGKIVKILNIQLLISEFMTDREMRDITGIATNANMAWTQSRLNDRFGIPLFERGTGSLNYAKSRINPRMRFRDLREGGVAVTEFIG
jgi:hypothetical protein